MGRNAIEADVAVRSNKQVEAAVERALVTALLDKSVSRAARVMYAAHVPLHVAKRVLLHPEARRATDWTGVLRQRL
jgi:hypothetical protein